MSATGQKLLHPIPQMTTFELKELRESIEQVLGMETLPAHTRSREELQADLDAVVKEQQERAIAERRSRERAQQA